MNKMFRKNQIIITALAVLIAVAGYLKYSDEGIKGENVNGTETASNKNDGTEPGDAIMVSSKTNSDVMINAKLQREQMRAQNKEELMKIVNNVDLSEAEKKSAVDKIAEISDISEKELSAETLIMSKGIDDVVVNMVDGNVEVIIGEKSLDDGTRVQVEDIVKRKFDVEISNITISLVGNK
ncbi:MAG: SpoIIIAH-like family protein [Lachnospiraceae bacterium]|nr:SpoIIIAH-like family protein [Lachnospiraceae bacterium]